MNQEKSVRRTAPNGDRPTALQLGQFWDSSKMTLRDIA